MGTMKPYYETDIIRVFPRKTKWTPSGENVFYGYAPLTGLGLPDKDIPVFISCVFTWDIQKAYKIKESWSIFYSDVKIGGPAFKDPGGEFEPGLFIKPGVTITSRGCIRNCPYCFVPKREGKIRELEIKSGWIVQDNNLLACSKSHIMKVFEMLSVQKKAIKFSGGLDSGLLKDWHIDEFLKLNVGELWFACDENKDLDSLKRALDMISDFPLNAKRCFVLMGFNGESIKEAERRVESVFEMGFLPFAQLYQSVVKTEYSNDWKKLSRKWSRPAAYKSIEKERQQLKLF